jgi:hypothetical protein
MFYSPRANVVESDTGYSLESTGIVGMEYREGARVMTVDSEILVTEEPTVAIWKDRIRAWKPPHDKEEITEERRVRILRNICAALKWRSVRVEICSEPTGWVKCWFDSEPLVKPTFAQKLFATGWFWTGGFVGITLGFTLAVAMRGFPEPRGMLALVPAGAMCGAVVGWVGLKTLGRFRMRKNGGPFRKGELVQVIGGSRGGTVTTVYEEWPTKNRVRVDVGEEAAKAGKDIYSHLQLCRVPLAEPGTAPRSILFD